MHSFSIFVPIHRPKFFFWKSGKEQQGRMDGSILFENGQITVNDTVYPLQAIEKISFTCFDDYEGRKEDFTKAGHTVKVSRGVDNKIVLLLKNGEEITVQFQLQRRYQIRTMRTELVHYHNEAKLHFLHLTNVLGIEDYNAIRIFKKSLNDGGDVKSY